MLKHWRTKLKQNSKPLIAGLAMTLVSGLGAATIAVQNNNPGNIRYYKANNWKGQTGQNKGFAVFESNEYGIRAMGIILRKRIAQNQSITQIVSSWAPPNENNTKNYINFVSKQLNYPADKPLSQNQLVPLIRVMIRMESGQQFSDDFIAKSLQM